MSKFLKQFVFILLAGVILTASALIIKGATPSGNIKMKPSSTAKIKMVKQENTTTTGNNPVGYWKLDDNNALTSVIDYSGKGNTGTAYSGTATTTSVLSTSTAMIGRAMSFNGTNEYVNVGSHSILQNFTAKSVFMWVKTTAFTGNYRYIMDGSYWASPYGDMFMLLNTSNNMNIYLRNTSGTAVFETIPYTPNVWIYVGYSWNGKT